MLWAAEQPAHPWRQHPVAWGYLFYILHIYPVFFVPLTSCFSSPNKAGLERPDVIPSPWEALEVWSSRKRNGSKATACVHPAFTHG